MKIYGKYLIPRETCVRSLDITYSKKVSIEITDDACDYGMKLFQRKRMQKDTLALIIYS